MKLSILIWYFEKLNKLSKLYDSIKNQIKENEVEIIIVMDDFDKVNSIETITFFQKIVVKKNIRIIVNQKNQGISTCWNIAKKYSKGEYVWFLKEDVLFEKNSLKKIFNNKNFQTKPDILELKIKILDKNNNSITKTFLPFDEILRIKNNKEIFAYINTNIYTKIFKRSILSKYNINFRYYLYYSILFLYKVLVHSEKFLTLDIVAISISSDNLKYSALNLLNQWPHIFNYFRFISKYDIYKEEIVYAYVKYITFTYINIIKEVKNKFLIKKSIFLINKKMNKKIIEFDKNKYINYKKEDDFNIYSKNLSKYLKSLNRKYL